jgi:hypothetical protein
LRRRGELAASWPSIERGADLLLACVADGHPWLAALPAPDSPLPRWAALHDAVRAGDLPDPAASIAAMEAGDWEALRPCLAQEDDAIASTTSLYSTHVTALGLRAAARAARALCVDADRAAAWDARADELAALAFAADYDAATGDWTGRADWVLWPEPLAIADAHAGFFSDSADPATQRADADVFAAQALDDLVQTQLGELLDAVALRTDGASYANKKALALARYLARSGGSRTDRLLLGAAVRRLAQELPMPGTRHVGEAWVSIDEDGDGAFDRADQRVAQPHLWTATLTYLAAMALAEPARFEAAEGLELAPFCADGDAPDLERPPITCDTDEGCGNVGGRASWPAVLLAAALARRRRR